MPVLACTRGVAMGGATVVAWESPKALFCLAAQARWLLTFKSAIWWRVDVFTLHDVAESARAEVTKYVVAA